MLSKLRHQRYLLMNRRLKRSRLQLLLVKHRRRCFIIQHQMKQQCVKKPFSYYYQVTNKNTTAKERLNGFIRLLHPGAIEEKLKNEAVSIIQEARQELEYDATQTRQSTLPTATTTKQDEETQQTRTPPKS